MYERPANAHGEVTLTANLDAYGKESVWMLGLQIWRSHTRGTTRRSWWNQRMTAMLSHLV